MAVGHFGDAEVTSAQLDSRKCVPGTLFFCMPGGTRDSHTFLPDALANGASAAVVYSSEGLERARSLGLPAVQLADVRRFVGPLCDALYGHPTRHMKVLGVTGTNGKTTTAWIARDLLAATGHRSAYLGTLGFSVGDEHRELANTTPFAVELFNLLAEARDKGVEALAMEVSSHALAEYRADAVEFDAAVFTNLTQDHLDFHGTMDAYGAAKARLFRDLPTQTEKHFVGMVNADDAFARTLAGGNVGRYGTQPGGDLQGEVLEVRVDRISIRLTDRSTGPAGRVVHVRLGGSYNVENLLSATAGLGALGYPVLALVEAKAFDAVRPVPGRFEPVENDRGIGILVDYAHTPDALEKLLDAVRPLTTGRVITVFGCGGDRDRTKRPLMAKAASERSDLTIATSDNPRTEDPQAILDEVVAGIVPGREFQSVIDRRDAIAIAVKAARPGDVVVIAGKGHENYQIIGRTKYPMDDRQLAREALG